MYVANGQVLSTLRTTRPPSPIGIRPGEKIHEEMITSSDSFTTYDLGEYYVILPQTTHWKLEEYIAHFGATPVPAGFNYTSGANEHFLTVEELRALIAEHVA